MSSFRALAQRTRSNGNNGKLGTTAATATTTAGASNPAATSSLQQPSLQRRGSVGLTEVSLADPQAQPQKQQQQQQQQHRPPSTPMSSSGTVLKPMARFSSMSQRPTLSPSAHLDSSQFLSAFVLYSPQGPRPLEQLAVWENITNNTSAVLANADVNRIGKSGSRQPASGAGTSDNNVAKGSAGNNGVVAAVHRMVTAVYDRESRSQLLHLPPGTAVGFLSHRSARQGASAAARLGSAPSPSSSSSAAVAATSDAAALLTGVPSGAPQRFVGVQLACTHPSPPPVTIEIHYRERLASSSVSATARVRRLVFSSTAKEVQIGTHHARAPLRCVRSLSPNDDSSAALWTNVFFDVAALHRSFFAPATARGDTAASPPPSPSSSLSFKVEEIKVTCGVQGCAGISGSHGPAPSGSPPTGVYIRRVISVREMPQPPRPLSGSGAAPPSPLHGEKWWYCHPQDVSLPEALWLPCFPDAWTPTTMLTVCLSSGSEAILQSETRGQQVDPRAPAEVDKDIPYRGEVPPPLPARRHRSSDSPPPSPQVEQERNHNHTRKNPAHPHDSSSVMRHTPTQIAKEGAHRQPTHREMVERLQAQLRPAIPISLQQQQQQQTTTSPPPLSSPDTVRRRGEREANTYGSEATASEVEVFTVEVPQPPPQRPRPSQRARASPSGNDDDDDAEESRRREVEVDSSITIPTAEGFSRVPWDRNVDPAQGTEESPREDRRTPHHYRDPHPHKQQQQQRPFSSVNTATNSYSGSADATLLVQDGFTRDMLSTLEQRRRRIGELLANSPLAAQPFAGECFVDAGVQTGDSLAASLTNRPPPSQQAQQQQQQPKAKRAEAEKAEEKSAPLSSSPPPPPPPAAAAAAAKHVDTLELWHNSEGPLMLPNRPDPERPVAARLSYGDTTTEESALAASAAEAQRTKAGQQPQQQQQKQLPLMRKPGGLMERLQAHQELPSGSALFDHHDSPHSSWTFQSSSVLHDDYSNEESTSLRSRQFVTPAVHHRPQQQQQQQPQQQNPSQDTSSAAESFRCLLPAGHPAAAMGAARYADVTPSVTPDNSIGSHGQNHQPQPHQGQQEAHEHEQHEQVSSVPVPAPVEKKSLSTVGSTSRHTLEEPGRHLSRPQTHDTLTADPPTSSGTHQPKRRAVAVRGDSRAVFYTSDFITQPYVSSADFDSSSYGRQRQQQQDIENLHPFHWRRVDAEQQQQQQQQRRQQQGVTYSQQERYVYDPLLECYLDTVTNTYVCRSIGGGPAVAESWVDSGYGSSLRTSGAGGIDWADISM